MAAEHGQALLLLGNRTLHMVPGNTLMVSQCL